MRSWTHKDESYFIVCLNMVNEYLCCVTMSCFKIAHMQRSSLILESLERKTHVLYSCVKPLRAKWCWWWFHLFVYFRLICFISFFIEKFGFYSITSHDLFLFRWLKSFRQIKWKKSPNKVNILFSKIIHFVQ